MLDEGLDEHEGGVHEADGVEGQAVVHLGLLVEFEVAVHSEGVVFQSDVLV